MKLNRVVKRKIIIALITIVIMLISIFLLAYSLFYRTRETEENVINYGELVINYANDSEQINRTLDYPRSDEEGNNTIPYTFTIRNDGDIDANYVINIENDTDYINANNLSIVEDSLMNYSINSGEAKTTSEIDNDELLSGELSPGDEVTYSLRFWLKDGAPNTAIGKSFVKKINVKANYIP